MRLANNPIVILVVLAGAWALWKALGAGDTVKKSYASLEEAREGRLFLQGWLPDVLPPSTRDIQAANNIVDHTSTGRFSFEAAEYSFLASRTSPADPAQIAGGRPSEGFEIRTLTIADWTWLFYCKPQVGYCEYVLQGRRDRGQD